MVQVFTANARSVCVRALLDQGSEATFISEALSQLLKPKKTKTNTIISGIGPIAVTSRFHADIGIGPKGAQIPLLSAKAIVLPKLTTYTARPPTRSSLCPQLNHLKLADDDSFGQRPIDLIIGADLYGCVLLDGVIRGGDNYPGAQNTVFGWVLSGRCGNSTSSGSVHTHHSTLDALSPTIPKSWKVKSVPTRTHSSKEDCATPRQILTAHSRKPNGRCVVTSPLNGDAHDPARESRHTVRYGRRGTGPRLHANLAKQKDCAIGNQQDQHLHTLAPGYQFCILPGSTSAVAATSGVMAGSVTASLASSQSHGGRRHCIPRLLTDSGRAATFSGFRSMRQPRSHNFVFVPYSPSFSSPTAPLSSVYTLTKTNIILLVHPSNFNHIRFT